MNVNKAQVSNDLSDVPGLQIRRIRPFRLRGQTVPLVRFADASKVRGNGIRVDLGDQTLKALLRDPVTVRLPNVNGVLGSKADDRIVGTAESDYVVGKAGEDVIRGEGETDFLIGNGQGDALFGGAGADLILGDGGFTAPLLAVLDFGDDLDSFTLNPGLTTFTKAGRDLILGGSGGDLISGGALSDTVKGGSGADVIFGDGGRDDINGGKGIDRITGGRGADLLTGGLGRDSFIYFTPKEGGDRITDFDPTQDFIELFPRPFKLNNVVNGLVHIHLSIFFVFCMECLHGIGNHSPVGVIAV